MYSKYGNIEEHDDSLLVAGNRATVYFADEKGNKYGIKQIDNKPRFSSMPYLYDIAEGHVPNHKPFFKLGYNVDIGSTEEDVWAVGGKYVFPTTGQQMELVSTSVEDDILTAVPAAGTGIHKVKVSYLDNNYVAKTEEVTLNGQAVVTTVATNILRVNALRASVVGSGKKAAGDITIRNLADTPVYRSISTGLTRGREGVYTVPFGKKLFITNVNVSSGYATVNRNVTWTGRASYDDVNETVLDFMMPWFETHTMDSSFGIFFDCPRAFPAKTDIVISAIADAQSVCMCAMRGWIEDE